MNMTVTGATGGLGSLVIDHLLKLGQPAGSITALVRSKEKAQSLNQKGVKIHVGNYADVDSMKEAFKGSEKVLLISSSEVGKRFEQHKKAIDAAKAAGVKQVVYTSIARADTSKNPLAPEHKQTEEYLAKSGLDYAILRNNWYLENYAGDLAYAKISGQLAFAGPNARVGSASRTDYAEAAARVLASGNHSGKIYELGGPVWDYTRLAKAASEVFGKPVTYNAVSASDRKAALLQAGLSEGFADFFVLLEESLVNGSLDLESSDLETLLKRKPLSLEEGIRLLG